MQRYRKYQFIYLLTDTISAELVWLCFLLFRWLVYEGRIFTVDTVLIPAFNFYAPLIFYPAICLIIYYLSGFYLSHHRHVSWRKEVRKTLFSAFIISALAFFIIIIDDEVERYTQYYMSFLVLFLLQTTLSLLPRLSIFAIWKRKLVQKNTAIIGTEDAAQQWEETYPEEKIACVIAPQDIHLFKQIKKEYNIEKVLILQEGLQDDNMLYRIISQLYPTRVDICFSSRIYDMLTGAARIQTIQDAPVVTITAPAMSDVQICTKRFLDVIVSICALVLLSPILLCISLAVVCTSKGKALYTQTRVGLYGKPFQIVKFRTMYEGAEQDTPLLSTPNDERVTPVGRFLRKYRLDELPQFYNIIKGDMSLVGPRPERAYYIEQIMEKAPYYCLLYKIRPGLTSWGPIRVGYTDTLDKMIQRLNYDMVYIENMSIRLDLQILLKTFRVLLDGRGQ